MSTPSRPRRTTSRQFHAPRPTTGGPRSNIVQQPSRNQKFQDLPAPTGQSPYHLSLDQVLPPDQIKAIQSSGRVLFQVAGDTGGVKAPQSQLLVAMNMEQQFNFDDISARPAFFYHLGDVVYYYGEAKEYY